LGALLQLGVHLWCVQQHDEWWEISSQRCWRRVQLSFLNLRRPLTPHTALQTGRQRLKLTPAGHPSSSGLQAGATTILNQYYDPSGPLEVDYTGTVASLPSAGLLR
jgi:hypothetical protein